MGDNELKKTLIALNAARQKQMQQMQDKELLQNFIQSTPANLKYTNPNMYNMKGWWESLGRPQKFDYSQPVDPYDKVYHAFSRNPETGEILKSPQHPTFRQAIVGDVVEGYNPYVSPEGKIFTIKSGDKIPSGFVPYMYK